MKKIILLLILLLFIGGANATNLIGYLDSPINDQFPGWACDADNPNELIAIHLYFDRVANGNSDMIMAASLDGEDAIGNLCGGNNNHRFVFQASSSLKDGQPHQIYAYGVKYQTTNESFQLSQSPITYTYTQLSECNYDNLCNNGEDYSSCLHDCPFPSPICEIDFLQDRTFENGFVGSTFDERYPLEGKVNYPVSTQEPFWVLMELTPSTYFVDNLPQPKNTSPITFESANGKKKLISNKDGSIRFIYDSSTEENNGNSITPPYYAQNTDWLHYGLGASHRPMPINDFDELRDSIEWKINKADIKNGNGVIFNNAYLFGNSNKGPNQPPGLWMTLQITKSSGIIELYSHFGNMDPDQSGVPIIPITTISGNPVAFESPGYGVWKSYDFELTSLFRKAVEYYNANNTNGWTINYDDFVLVELSHHTEIWGGVEMDWELRNWSLIGKPKTNELCNNYQLKTSHFNIKGSLDNQIYGDKLAGWACNSKDFSQSLDYRVYINNPKDLGGTLIGTENANVNAEQAVADKCGGYNTRRFAFSVPGQYCDNQDHEVYFYVKDESDNQWVPLPNTPQEIMFNCPQVQTNPICSQFPNDRFSSTQFNTHIAEWRNGDYSLLEILRRAKIWKWCN